MNNNMPRNLGDKFVYKIIDNQQELIRRYICSGENISSWFRGKMLVYQ